MSSHRMMYKGLLVGAIAMALAGCGEKAQPLEPILPTASSSCSLDGMYLLDYPGPKGQIRYANGETDFFCDTVELFSIYLRPEQQRKVAQVYTQDMGAAEWGHPEGHWFDARTGFYVYGSKLHGAMGPTLAAFAKRSDAEAFSAKHGGKVYAFAEITPQMVVLDGGVVHDEQRM